MIYLGIVCIRKEIKGRLKMKWFPSLNASVSQVETKQILFSKGKEHRTQGLSGNVVLKGSKIMRCLNCKISNSLKSMLHATEISVSIQHVVGFPTCSWNSGYVLFVFYQYIFF